MSFFKSVVFLDVMKIVTADYDRSLHFHLFNNSCQNTTPDTDVACEWAFLVNVMSINCLKKMTICKYLKHTFSIKTWLCFGFMFLYSCDHVSITYDDFVIKSKVSLHSQKC